MKYVENGGDVRSTSANAAYMGVVFQGTVDEAIAQAKAQTDHGIPAVNGRAELLAFLRVKPAVAPHDRWIDVVLERDSLIPAAKPANPWDKFSPFSLEYAAARWPESFYRAPDADQSVADRFANLNESQLLVYGAYRTEFGVLESLAKAEAFPYPINGVKS